MDRAYSKVKSSKKIAKYARKMTRKAMNEKLTNMKEIVKNKPRWLPKFIWRALLHLCLNFQLYKTRYEQTNDKQTN